MPPFTDTTNASPKSPKRSSIDDLEKHTLVELKALCKKANVPGQGKKPQLIRFLLNPELHQKWKRKMRTSESEAAKAMVGPWSCLKQNSTINQSDRDLVDPVLAKKSLRRMVSSLANILEAEWYDSDEQTIQKGVYAHRYMNEVIQRSEACLRIIGMGMGYDSAFRTLCTIVDTWDDLNTIHIDFRKGLMNILSDGEYDPISFADDEELLTVDNPQELVDMVLPIVMVKAASDPVVPDSALERMLRDATDHHVTFPHVAAALEYYNKDDDALTQNLSTWLADGQNRLAPLYQAFQWDLLPSWKTNHTRNFDNYYYY